MAATIAAFEAWTDGLAVQIVGYVNPALRYPEDVPTLRYPLSRLSVCVYVCAAYLALVAVGVLLKHMRHDAPGRQGGDAPRSSAPKSEAINASKPEGVLQSFVRDPLKSPLVAYNAVQILLCAWMCVAALTRARALGYALICNGFDPRDTAIAEVEWVFYASKALDFVDTLFIIARRKWEQLSFLHTYHHVSIFATYWLVNSTGFVGDVNAFIHFLMYTHYLLTCFKFKAWWAKYLTQLQMFQFVFMIGHGLYMFFNPTCGYPHRLTGIYLVYIFFMLLLFINFYVGKHHGGAKRASKPKQA